MLRRAVVHSLLLFTAVFCHADGGFFGKAMPDREVAQSGVSSPHQKAVIIQPDPGTEILLLQTTYQGPVRHLSATPGNCEHQSVHGAKPGCARRQAQAATASIGKWTVRRGGPQREGARAF